MVTNKFLNFTFYELKKNIDENNLKEILEKCSTSEEIFNIIENISK